MTVRALTIAAAIGLSGLPTHALEVGDRVRFSPNTPIGRMWLEDAKKATAHMARYGNSKESTRFFIDQISGDMFARREGYPKSPRRAASATPSFPRTSPTTAS
jgi:hypothetical protein